MDNRSHCHLEAASCLMDKPGKIRIWWKQHSVATYDANRIVKCGFYDEYNFYGGTHRTDLSGKCSYMGRIAGVSHLRSRAM